MTLYKENVWSKNHSRQTQRTLHWVMQLIGSMTAFAGISCEFIGHVNGTTFYTGHFTTRHSVIGLIAAIFTLIGMISGMSSLWSANLKQYTRPIYFKLVHNFVGIAAFVLGNVFSSDFIFKFNALFYF